MSLSRTLLCTALLAASTTALAVETKLWTRSEALEFDKGKLKGLSLASDGRLTLAPRSTQTLDAGVAQLWSIATAGARTYAGANEGKLYVVEADGKSRLLTTLEGSGTIYALAADGDGVVAATSPDGKIWRVAKDGKATLFCATKAHYVWALIATAKGGYYAATGDPGQVLSIDAQGNAKVFFDAGETHVRSLIATPKGELIAGTDSSGLIVRINAKGEAMVLHQTGKREVNSLLLAADGTIYASAAGARSATPPAPVAAPLPEPQAAPAPANGAPQAPGAPNAQNPAALRAVVSPVPQRTALTGGCELWRIGADGERTLYWSHPLAVIYALAFDGEGRVLAATGNEGRLYRIDTPHAYTRLLHIESTQITALGARAGGGVWAATSNPGRLIAVDKQLEATGTYESDVFDATAFTRWGRLRWEAEARGGAVKFETRSGNLDAPEKHWSEWNAIDEATGARIASPAARFLQFRATLTGAANTSPELTLVEAAYQQKNVAPVLERIETTPYNHKFPAPSAFTPPASTTLALPPLGQTRRTSPSTPNTENAGAATMSHERGWVGARWKAADANGDAMEFKVEYRGVEEREWKLLKDHLRENRYSWDAATLADGRYVVRVTATDAPDNFEADALTATIVSEPFLVDNTAPRIDNLTAKLEGTKIVVRFHAEDDLNALEEAEFSVNGGEWTPARPTTLMTDSAKHDYTGAADAGTLNEWTVAVRVADAFENQTVRKIVVKR